MLLDYVGKNTSKPVKRRYGLLALVILGAAWGSLLYWGAGL